MRFEFSAEFPATFHEALPELFTPTGTYRFAPLKISRRQFQKNLSVFKTFLHFQQKRLNFVWTFRGFVGVPGSSGARKWFYLITE